MGLLIGLAAVMLVGLALLGFLGYLLAQVGIAAALALFVAGIGMLAIAAAIGFAATLAFFELGGRSAGAWPLVGGFLVGAVAAMALLQGLVREVRGGPRCLPFRKNTSQPHEAPGRGVAAADRPHR